VAGFASAVDWINLVLFSALGVVAVVQWRAGRGRAGIWAGLAFAALAFVADVGRLLPDDPETALEQVATRVLLAALVLFPYFLYRFTTAFRPPTRGLERFLGWMTVFMLVWTFVLPDVPADGEPWPPWFVAYVAGFLVHFSVLTIVVAVRLWRAGRAHPGVTRRRMEMFALGTAAITAALLLAGTAPDEDSWTSVAVALLGTLSGLTFLLGLAPPAALRALWRRPEQRRVQDAIADLMTATSEHEVAERVLPPMAAIVGARALALQAEDGRIVGSHGASPELLDELAREPEDGRPHVNSHLVTLPMPFGRLAVWTSSYAPYFGGDELRLLATLGALAGLALDRSRLFAYERGTRVALERADELKTQFVALAAHELRTPVTSIHGIARTLEARLEQLTPDVTHELVRTLAEQTTRMASLVEQLLDLSRLEAHAIPIQPEPIAVRSEVEDIVSGAAGERTGDVKVDIEPKLVTVVDRNALERIVTNLVVNALRYGAAPVTLTAAQHDRHFRLAVEDRGEGVPHELVPQLFERFTRGPERRGPGTGLGLAIAQAYARAHGGDLAYEAARPSGARFEVVLPVSTPLNGPQRSRSTG
jgi:signal transduction histidine kinase